MTKKKQKTKKSISSKRGSTLKLPSPDKMGQLVRELQIFRDQQEQVLSQNKKNVNPKFIQRFISDIQSEVEPRLSFLENILKSVDNDLELLSPLADINLNEETRLKAAAVLKNKLLSSQAHYTRINHILKRLKNKDDFQLVVDEIFVIAQSFEDANQQALHELTQLFSTAADSPQPSAESPTLLLSKKHRKSKKPTINVDKIIRALSHLFEGHSINELRSMVEHRITKELDVYLSIARFSLSLEQSHSSDICFERLRKRAENISKINLNRDNIIAKTHAIGPQDNRANDKLSQDITETLDRAIAINQANIQTFNCDSGKLDLCELLQDWQSIMHAKEHILACQEKKYILEDAMQLQNLLNHDAHKDYIAMLFEETEEIVTTLKNNLESHVSPKKVLRGKKILNTDLNAHVLLEFIIHLHTILDEWQIGIETLNEQLDLVKKLEGKPLEALYSEIQEYINWLRKIQVSPTLKEGFEILDNISEDGSWLMSLNCLLSTAQNSASEKQEIIESPTLEDETFLQEEIQKEIAEYYDKIEYYKTQHKAEQNTPINIANPSTDHALSEAERQKILRALDKSAGMTLRILFNIEPGTLVMRDIIHLLICLDTKIINRKGSRRHFVLRAFKLDLPCDESVFPVDKHGSMHMPHDGKKDEKLLPYIPKFFRGMLESAHCTPDLIWPDLYSAQTNLRSPALN